MKSKSIIMILFWALLFVNESMAQESWQSQLVHIAENGDLTYFSDAEGNRIPNFSYAGYMNGDEPIPDVPVVNSISPVSGDNTAHIQSAIDDVGALDPDSYGIRGALILEAGTYEVSGTIYLNYSGVVLRGAGDGSNPADNSIIRATGNSPEKRTVIIAGGGSSTSWSDAVADTRTDIISDSVMVGSRTFEVEDAGPFQVGDNIIIYHPCTEEWLEAIDYGGTHYDEPGGEPGVDEPWAVNSQPIIFNRNIMEINGNQLTIDAPVFNHLIRSLSQSYIYKYARGGLLTNIGIENLRVDIETSGENDENHAWNAIDLYQLEDAWVSDCTMLHFGLSGIRTNTATRVTVKNCQALDPHSVLEGFTRYNYHLYTSSQQILFENCHASNGRHHYVSNGTSRVSGCVFYNCTSSGANTSSEGHRRWSMGLLFDNHVELDGPPSIFEPRLLGLYNRGNYGTSHGWAAAHSVCWNCDVGDGNLAVQKPPTAQNYAIGCFGNQITGSGFFTCPFDELEGYIEGSNQAGLNPSSLYLAQLSDRQGPPSWISEAVSVPASPQLFPNYPNPFNSQTTISYRLIENSEVLLTISNTLGQRTETLVSGKQSAGYYKIPWNAGFYSSGLYYLQLKTNNRVLVQKMILLK